MLEILIDIYLYIKRKLKKNYCLFQIKTFVNNQTQINSLSKWIHLCTAVEMINKRVISICKF